MFAPNIVVHASHVLNHVTRYFRVTGTLSIIAFLVYSPQLFLIWPWYGREFSLELLKLLVPFKCVSCFHNGQPTYWS